MEALHVLVRSLFFFACFLSPGCCRYWVNSAHIIPDHLFLYADVLTRCHTSYTVNHFTSYLTYISDIVLDWVLLCWFYRLCLFRRVTSTRMTLICLRNTAKHFPFLSWDFLPKYGHLLVGSSVYTVSRHGSHVHPEVFAETSKSGSTIYLPPYHIFIVLVVLTVCLSFLMLLLFLSLCFFSLSFICFVMLLFRFSFSSPSSLICFIVSSF